MLFNSLSFVVFLPIVFTGYWCLPHKYRWILLLSASYYFYMSWNAEYICLIFFFTFISYGAARLLENQKRGRKITLVITLILCFCVLFFFKYFNFVSESVRWFLSLFSIQINPMTIKILLPVGISFYTFQSLSYVIDVYNGVVPAEKHFGYYATFISFFPQLVAGPIERTNNLLPQIKAIHKFDYEQATYGIKLMAWGFFKKIVFADTLSKYVTTVYDNPQEFVGGALLIASVLFSLQIYCDFSGYSDIAIGTAKLMGINLVTNFKSPYFSQSIKEFWNRWHISLSTYLRDYIYIPLGGNRVGKARYMLNIMITFLLSGLWHGSNWTFVIWGGIHGASRTAENLIRKIKKKNVLSSGIRVLCVFLFVTFAWIFFRSNSTQDALYVIRNLFVGIKAPIVYLKKGIIDIGMWEGWSKSIKLFLHFFFTLLALALYDYISLKRDVIKFVSSKKTPVRWSIYCIVVMWILLYVPVSNKTKFIYFQF